MTRASSLLFAVLIVGRAASAQSDQAARIDAFITPFAEAGHFSGVVVVGRSGTPILEKAYGFANAEHRVPNTPETRIGIASITKSMTGVIVRKLIEERKLSMDDRVAKFFPDFPQGDRITVGMLFRHRSGIPHRVMPTEMEAIPQTSAQMVDRIKLAKLAFEPGSARLYSSAGYSLLARILELASGKSYADLLREYVFAPAGMRASVDYSGRPILPGRAADYLIDAGGLYNAPAKDYTFLIGAGSVVSTARDVHSFAIALTSGIFGDSVRAGYLADRTWWSNGLTNGHRAETRVNGEHNYSYALVSNLNSGANDVILQAIRDIMEGKTVTPPTIPQPRFIARSPSDLAQYRGFYEREGGGSFEIKEDGSSLYAGDIKLDPTGGDCFFEFRFYGEVCFARNAARAITHISWASPGVTSTWVKQPAQ
jgi:CubicO group peptidase (beta-lactamase class C family)